MHNLSLSEQKSILEFSLFLTNKMQKNKPVEEKLANNESSFAIALDEFLRLSQLDPVDIDTSIFDKDRANEHDRDVDL